MQFDYNAAKQAGYSDQEIQQFMQQQGIAGTPSGQAPAAPSQQPVNPTAVNPALQQSQSMPPNPGMPAPSSGMRINASTLPDPNQIPRNQPNGFVKGVEDWLPTIGAVGGGLLGTAVAPGVGSVAGAGAGGALGEALKEKLQGKQFNAGDIALQGGLGAVGEGVGGVVAKGVGAAVGKLGDIAATNGLNLTRLTQGKFAAKFGEPIAKVLQDNGIPGVNAADLEAGIKPFQANYDKIATANVPVDPNVFLNNAISRIEELKNSPVPSIQAIGKKAEEALGGIVDKWHDGFSIGDLNSARKAFDKATTDSQFGSDIWGVNREVGQVLRNSIQDAAAKAEEQGLLPGGSQLKQIGQNLQRLYTIRDLAAGREASGGGGSPFSVTNLLLETGVGGVGASIAGHNPLLGGLGMLLMRKAISNPSVAKVLSPTLTTSGEAIGSGVGQEVGRAAGAAAATAAPGTINPTSGPSFSNGSSAFPTSATSSQGGFPQGVTKDPTTGAITLPELKATGVQQIYTPEAYAQDMAKAVNDPVTQSQLTQIYKASQDSANSYINRNGLSDGEQENMRGAYNTNYLANEVRTLMAQTPPNFLGKFKDFQQLASYNNGQYAALGTALQRLQAEVGKQLQGGVLRGYDINVLSVTPQLGDSPDAAMAKLDQVQTLLSQQYMNLYGKYGLNTQTPAGAGSPGAFAGQ